MHYRICNSARIQYIGKHIYRTVFAKPLQIFIQLKSIHKQTLPRLFK